MIRLHLGIGSKINWYRWVLSEKRKQKKMIKKFSDNNVSVQEGVRFYMDSQIGEYTYLGRYCDVTRATIGRYCAIGNFVVIGGGEHRIDRIAAASALIYPEIDCFEDTTKKELLIKNDVWIGTNAIIKRGVTIGNGAVIGANSFVDKDVPDYAVAVGVPARVIKYRFSEEIIKELLESKWWEKDKDEAVIAVRELETKLKIKIQE